MELLKKLLRAAYDRLDLLLDAAFGQKANPLSWLGALGWYLFWIVAVSGIYLFIFFDTGITRAYASVEYMTNEQWYLAGVMRSLHRYASDALVIVVFVHLLREFALDRLRGKRFFAWITGIPSLVFIYICGISGYWLVWDQLAQYIAVASTEWLDALPLFGEPVAANFLNSTTLGSRLFTLMVYLHIFVPLAMLLLMWVHVQRHAGARVNPPRSLAIGTLVALLVLSLLVPARSQGPADLDVVPATLGFDWFYLLGYPLLDRLNGAQAWLLFAVVLSLLGLLPWLPPAKPRAAAVVNLEQCNGCGRCLDDCPFSAISMVPRSDGRSYDTEAAVIESHCMSCGICFGACPTATPFRRRGEPIAGIELPDYPLAKLLTATTTAMDPGRRATLLVFACEHCGIGDLAEPGMHMVTVPCSAMLPPSFIDFALARDLADGVAVTGCAGSDCYYRLGDSWTAQRIARNRDPYLRARVDRARLRHVHARRGSPGRTRTVLQRFRDELARQQRDDRDDHDG